MMTLAYSATIKEFGKFSADGFMVATIEGGKIKNIEGIFTTDYLNIKVKEDSVTCEYFALNHSTMDLEKEFEVTIMNSQLEDEEFHLPLDFIARVEGKKIKFETKERLQNPLYYKAKLEEFWNSKRRIG